MSDERMSSGALGEISSALAGFSVAFGHLAKAAAMAALDAKLECPAEEGPNCGFKTAKELAEQAASDLGIEIRKESPEKEPAPEKEGGSAGVSAPTKPETDARSSPDFPKARAALSALLTGDGPSPKIHEILERHGAKKLSEVKASELADVAREAEEAAHAG